MSTDPHHASALEVIEHNQRAIEAEETRLHRLRRDAIQQFELVKDELTIAELERFSAPCKETHHYNCVRCEAWVELIHRRARERQGV